MKLRRRMVVHGTPDEIEAAVRELSPEHRYFVEIIRLDPPPTEADEALDEANRKMTSRTPEQIQADREALIAASRKPRPLPTGKTLEDVMKEFWERFPPAETDEEVEDALEEMS
jgi:hypothetical protein